MLTFRWIRWSVGPWQPADDITDYKEHTAKKQRAHEHEHGHAGPRRDSPFCILHFHRSIKDTTLLFFISPHFRRTLDSISAR